MASIPQLYSDYQFPSGEFSNVTSVIAQENHGCATFPQVNFPLFYDNNSNNNNDIEFEGYLSEIEAFSRVPVNFSDQFGVNCDTRAAVPCSSNSSPYLDYNLGYESNIFGGNISRNCYSPAAGFQFSSGSSCEYGEDCCGFVPNLKPFCPELTGDNWGIQCNQMPEIGSTNNKIGRYTVEERKDRILKYLKKRNQRNFNKTIKYACRKTLADRRIRVQGRFARNNELCEEENTMKNTNNNPLQDEDSFSNNSLEMKNEDDDWLQEAVASLMYHI